jgi:hypothetical protein
VEFVLQNEALLWANAGAPGQFLGASRSDVLAIASSTQI